MQLHHPSPAALDLLWGTKAENMDLALVLPSESITATGPRWWIRTGGRGRGACAAGSIGVKRGEAEPSTGSTGGRLRLGGASLGLGSLPPWPGPYLPTIWVAGSG